jgi:hypothetical protein
MRYPAITGPICEPPERNIANSAMAVAKYLSINISAIILGPKLSTLPAPNVARILAPSKPWRAFALTLQIVPPRKMSMETRMTGRLPMHMASGIQKRLEIPRAKTPYEMRSVRGPKPVRNCIAMTSKPVVIPDWKFVNFWVSWWRLKLAYGVAVSHEHKEANICENCVSDPCWPPVHH